MVLSLFPFEEIDWCCYNCMLGSLLFCVAVCCSGMPILVGWVLRFRCGPMYGLVAATWARWVADDLLMCRFGHHIRIWKVLCVLCMQRG